MKKSINRSAVATRISLSSFLEKSEVKYSIAMLDWGIGGIEGLKLLEKKWPDIPLLYISDSGFKPYGKVSKEGLQFRLLQLCKELANHGVKILWVACNAMSSVLEQVLSSSEYKENVGPDFHIIGVHFGVVDSFDFGRKDSEAIGIVGGKRTIDSGLYEKPLFASGHSVQQRIAQPLSALIEAGKINTDEFSRELHSILEPILHVEHLILACTHYPAAKKQFKELMPRVKIINPVEISIKFVEQALEEDLLINLSKNSQEYGASGTSNAGENEKALVCFLTTGNGLQSRLSAQKAFDYVTSEWTEIDPEVL